MRREMLSGLRAIKAYAREDAMCARFNERNDEAVEAYYNADYYGSIVGPSVNFINNLSMSLISAFGVILFLRGAVSLGNVSTFILYSRKFSGPINEFANILSELQSAASAAERVFRLLRRDGGTARREERTRSGFDQRKRRRRPCALRLYAR